MTLTFGSLFAGVGGFDMGFEKAGFECKFQVEWDKNCRQILNKHWPDIPKWGDVSDVNGAEIPPVDCIIFGSPCQDLSVAGKRAGLEGERSGLFHEAVRIIKEMRDATNGTFPRWTVWENVAGALSSNNGRDFGTVVNEMAKAGAYLQEYALLDAQHFGIPQRRRRVFLVSCFDPAAADRCPDPLLPVTESLRGDSKKGKPKGQSAARKIAESVGSDGGILGSEIVGSLNTSDAKMISNQYVNENKCVVEPILLDGTRVDDVRVYEPPVQTLKERMGTGGNNVPVIGFSHTQGLSAQPSEDAFPTLRTEGHGMAVAYDQFNDSISEIHHVLRAGTKQSTGVLESTMAVRRLTPLECERLMGWPDDHTRYKADGTEQADTHRYRQCGNGVASPVAQWVAEQMTKVEYAKG
jgi:DNA (cytosine-5)-methyltransferase 1